MKRIVSGILAVLMVLCLSCGAFAAIKTVSPGDDFYYLDTANVLSESTEGEIYFCNTRLYDECGAQICIVALDTINGASTEDYALDLATKWGIGSKDKNNGFLLLMAIKEDDYYAIAGNGLQKIFPASVIKDYYDKYLENDFAAKDYDAGARKFFEAVFSKVVDFYNLNLSVDDGVKAYEAFVADSAESSAYGGAVGAGGGSASVNSSSSYYDDEYEEYSSFKVVLGAIILIVILVIIFRPRHRYRGPYGGPYYGGPGPHGPYGGPGHGPYGGPRTGFGGRSYGGGHSSYSSSRSSFGSSSRSSSSFGSSRSSSSFGSSRSSGFGGGRSGGGGGFGGGAGRGRH